MVLRPCAAFVAATFALSALMGCASLDSERSTGTSSALISQPARDAGATSPSTMIASSERVASTSSEAIPSASDPLDIERIQSIARRENPTFQEFVANLAAARAEVVQALLYPNPEAEFSLGVARPREDIGGNEMEYGLNLSQPIELPSKRRARRAAAEAGIPIVERDEDIFRTSLRAEVAKAFWTIAYFEEAIRLAEENVRIAQEIEAVVNRRVTGGESAEIEQIKAKVESLKASRAVQAQKRRVAAARASLNALCGGTLSPNFPIVGELAAESGAIDLSDAIRDGAGHPLLLKIAAQITRQEAVITREKKAWHPDIKPGVFADRESDTDKFGMTLGVELPIFNRNQGGIAGAKAELSRLAAEREATRIEVERRIQEAWQAHESAREQIAAYGAGLREGAAEALKIDTFLYEQGETNFLQLLDARRTAQETEAEYLQAIFDARISRAELEQAMGIGGIEP